MDDEAAELITWRRAKGLPVVEEETAEVEAASNRTTATLVTTITGGCRPSTTASRSPGFTGGSGGISGLASTTAASIAGRRAACGKVRAAEEKSPTSKAARRVEWVGAMVKRLSGRMMNFEKSLDC